MRRIIRSIVISMRKQKIHHVTGSKFFKGSDISLRTYMGKNCHIYGKVIDSCLEGTNTIWGELYHSVVGRASYVAPRSKLEYCNIGRYTSIGSNVRIVRGQHPSKTWVSTAPCFYSTRQQMGFSYVNEPLFQEFRWVDEERQVSVDIGNDVWIGDSVILLEGIKINDGAIVAAGSVVVKDVPSFSIVGGNPAKQIRSRFTHEEIEYLERLKWWEKDEEWIRRYAKYFDSVQHLKNILSQENNIE